jgi:hypothetical protein
MSYKELILESHLYQSGEPFTLSDMVGRIGGISSVVARELDSLQMLGFLIKTQKKTTNTYSKTCKTPLIHCRKLADYEPPLPASKQHCSRWMLWSNL